MPFSRFLFPLFGVVSHPLSLLSKDLAAKALSTKDLGCFSLGLQLRCGAAAHVRIAIGRCACQSSSS